MQTKECPVDLKHTHNAVAGIDKTDQISWAVADIAHRGGEPYPDIRPCGDADKPKESLMQTGDLNLPDQTGGPEKVHVLQTKHAGSHTTFFDKKNGLWRQG